MGKEKQSDEKERLKEYKERIVGENEENLKIENKSNNEQ